MIVVMMGLVDGKIGVCIVRWVGYLSVCVII